MNLDKYLQVNIARYKTLLWILAFIITVSSAIYQRLTGPTYPVRGKIIFHNQKISYKLLRSEVITRDAAIRLEVPDTAITGFITFRRYRSHDNWSTIPLQRQGEVLVGFLPKQPSAGKIAYFVHLARSEEEISLSGEQPIILRYKGVVPAWVLIPHIIVIFLAMVFSNRTALEALDPNGESKKYLLWTIALFFIGGFILGPAVQKYAFNAWWTGIPFGTDLTDNKTLIAMLGWLWAWYKNRQQHRQRGWIIVAALLMVAVYLIPHSVWGSELDYTQLPATDKP